MRVGLVLGAGGVIGGAWLMGALEALEAETGWRAAEAERIVGTSAGAVIGALAAAGAPPLQGAPPPTGPGWWRRAMTTLPPPHRHSPAAMIAGWLPRGFIST